MWSLIAFVATGWSILILTLLHVINPYDPLRDPISRYASGPRGDGMLAISLLSLMIAVLAVLGVVVTAGIPAGRTIYVLFALTAIGLALAAVFPASFTDGGDPLSGNIHQRGSLVGFLSIPGIGLALHDRLRSMRDLAHARARIAWVTAVVAMSLGLFGISYITAAFPGVPMITHISDLLPVGLTQRITVIADVVLLLTIVQLAVRHTEQPCETQPA